MKNISQDSMELSREMSRELVEAIVAGHKNCLENKESANLVVDGGFAWTKSNFIEDAIAKNVDVTFVKRTAGMSWQYLEFTIRQGEEEYLLIIKTPKTAEEAVTSNDPENYNKKYISINGTGEVSKYLGEAEQVTLMLDDLFDGASDNKVDSSISEYARCYFLIYNIDNISEMVTNVSLVLPTIDGKLSEVENLSQYIDYSYEKNITDALPINATDNTSEDTSGLHIYKAIEKEKRQTE